MKTRSDYEILKASVELADIGGGYFNPVDKFISVARKLHSDKLESLLSHPEIEIAQNGTKTFFISKVIAELENLLYSNELLFGLYDKGKYKVAVFIRSEERLMDFEYQVISGGLLRLGFFGVEEELAKEGLITNFILR